MTTAHLTTRPMPNLTSSTRSSAQPSARRVTEHHHRAEWLAFAGLLLLSAVPILAGASRVGQLSLGSAITPDNARFFASPLPVIVHIVSVTIFSTLGAWQFVPVFRRSHLRWHRVAGRIVFGCGLATAASGLWMTLFYPRPLGDGELLTLFRLVFGSAMAGSLVLSFLAIRKRDVATHRKWMLRGYAIGMGAGTQLFTHLPWFLLLGAPTEIPRAILMLAGWLINIAVAEWLIRRRPASAQATQRLEVRALRARAE